MVKNDYGVGITFAFPEKGIEILHCVFGNVLRQVVQWFSTLGSNSHPTCKALGSSPTYGPVEFFVCNKVYLLNNLTLTSVPCDPITTSRLSEAHVKHATKKKMNYFYKFSPLFISDC